MIANCIFEDNHALTSGGAIFVTAATVTVSNSIFWGNSAEEDGGGISAMKISRLVVDNCTFADNVAPSGAGIQSFYFASSIDVTNTIISSNGPGEGLFVEEGVALAIDHTDIYGNTGGNWVGRISGELGMNGNIEADPRFVDFLGRPFLLHPASSCIDTGNPSVEDYMYDWHPRVPPLYRDGARSDMGAYGGPGNIQWMPRALDHF